MVEVSAAQEQSSAGHKVLKGATYWFTGLSGAGKSTLSEYTKKFLDQDLGDSKKVFILDGDVIRTGLNKDLGFKPEDRDENIRRIAEVSKLLNLAGQIVFVAFISPYAKARDFAKELHTAAGLSFYEAYISATLETCEGRDVKGLYAKARAGVIPNFTGVSAPYEAPTVPDLNINTGEIPIEGCKNMVVRQMEQAGVLQNMNEPRVSSVLLTTPSADELAHANSCKFVDVDVMQAQFIQTIGEGFAFPLKGFMNEMELLEVMQMQTITDDTGKHHLHSVPITQHVTTAQKNALSGEKAIALRCGTICGDVLAVIHDPVFYPNRKEEIATRTFGTWSKKHPYVENIMEQGDWNVTGRMTFIKRITFNDGLDQYRLTPQEISNKIKERGADAVYAFQVRNPLHNGHVMLLNDTRQQLLKQGYKNPILLLHPLGGWCKDDDVPLDTRMRQHQALLDDGTLNPEHVILAVWPSPMLYGGPTEVLWHASSRVNCGITHFITGRDPAGVGHPEISGEPLYDVWHGQKILVHQKSLLNGVEVMPFKVAAYNTLEKKMAFFNPRTAKPGEFDFISGTRMRGMAKDGVNPPDGFMSPGGWEVLKDYYMNL